MAALGSPARTLRGLLRELRYMNEATGRPYRDTAAYRYLVKAFRAHRRPSHPARVLAKQIQALGRVSQELTKDQPNRKVAVEWRRPEDFIGWASAGYQ
ncbi:protein FMC1 homolog isoform X2 [Mustela putorius furo]|uniref:Protein FMC1 homolog n=1 Tax=Mustela putorius furo TaxID=9669 RepID=A0A8U0NN55_MUSPF|nr:protein FMC1 homolog isoform X2 [Mustela putorius furo]